MADCEDKFPATCLTGPPNCGIAAIFGSCKKPWTTLCGNNVTKGNVEDNCKKACGNCDVGMYTLVINTCYMSPFVKTMLL